MADQFVHVKGMSQLEAFLDQLPAKLEKNVMRGGLRAGVKMLAAAAAANIAGHGHGKVAASIKVSTGGSGGMVYAKVKAGVGFGKKGAPPANLPIWLEYGTRPHTTTAKNRKGLTIGGLFFQSVKHPGARPVAFMRPALDVAGAQAVVATAEYIKQRLATAGGLDTSGVDVGIET
jgi:hypothetical protein